VLRTKNGVQPVFVSSGHRIDLGSSVRVVLGSCRGYRLPEPTRQAHLYVNELRRPELERLPQRRYNWKRSAALLFPCRRIVANDSYDPQ